MRLMLIFLLFPFILGAQQMYDSPASPDYQRDFAERWEEFQNLPDTMYGVDPIEEMPIAPTAYDIMTGSYVKAFYDIGKWESWARANIKRTVWVFILDTSGEISHPALLPFSDPTMHRNFTSDAPFDAHGHGTHVAGCVAGKHPNNVPMGPASALGGNLKIVMVKVLGDNGRGGEAQIARGIDYYGDMAAKIAANGGLSIANLSLGGSGFSKIMAAAVERATKKGGLIVAAAGNSGREGVSAPANAPFALATASVGKDAKRSSFSSFGQEIFGAAPGAGIFSSYKNNSYALLSGTSMAAPTFAGMLALAGATSTASPAQLVAWSDDRMSQEWDKYVGNGWHIMQRIASDDIGSWRGEWPTEPPPPDDGPKEKFTVGISSDIDMLWQPQGGKARTSMLAITAEWRSPSIEGAEREADIWLRSYFSRVGFVLFSDSKNADAVFWARHFAEMAAKRDGINASFDIKWRAPSGAAVAIDRPRRKIASLFKRLRGDVQTQSLWTQ